MQHWALYKGPLFPILSLINANEMAKRHIWKTIKDQAGDKILQWIGAVIITFVFIICIIAFVA